MTEYMTAQETLAWVETGDADFATSVANDLPNRFALRLAEWVVNGNARFRKPERALRLIQERCANSRIVAYARPTNSNRRELVKSSDWTDLKLTMNFEVATKTGIAVFVDPVFRRRDVLQQFPPATPPAIGAEKLPAVEPKKPSAPGRKRGAPSLRDSDARFMPAMRLYVEEENRTRHYAAQIVWADHQSDIEGAGTEESKRKRIIRRYDDDRAERGLPPIGE